MSQIGRMAVPVICLMTDAACILSFFPFSWEIFAAAALLFAAASGLQLALHEMGHLLGGKMSGYRLLFLRIGPFWLERDREGKLAVSAGEWGDGQCAMVPGVTIGAMEACPYRLYNFGGILFNLLAGAMGAAGCSAYGKSAGWELFFLQLSCTGILHVYLNVIPYIRNGVPTDGYILRLLGREPAVRRDYAAYLQVYAFCRQGIAFDRQAYEYPHSPEGSMLFYDALQELLREHGAVGQDP